MEKNKLRLLVVEDEKKLCDMIAKSLHQAGYEEGLLKMKESISLVFAANSQRKRKASKMRAFRG